MFFRSLVVDKPWRLHVANSAIQHLNIIEGDPAFVAVWMRDGQVTYYELERGAVHGTSKFVLPENPQEYGPFVQKLKDSKDRRLTFARVGNMSFWPLENGSVLEYYGGAVVELYKGADTLPQTITFDVKPSALAIDPESQLVAAVDPKGALLLGKPGGTIKTMKPGLSPNDEMPVSVVVARGGKRLVVSDGTHLIVIDGGKVTAKRELHYTCSLLAIAPDGRRLLTFDSDSGVMRAYVPDDLRLTHQRFVVDILSSADELQLIGFAELPPMNAAVSAMAIDTNGVFAFAVSGQLCAASVNHLAPTDGIPTAGRAVTPPKAPPPAATAKPIETPAPKPKPATAAGTPSAKPTAPLKPSDDTEPVPSSKDKPSTDKASTDKAANDKKPS